MPRIPTFSARHRPGVVSSRPWCVEVSAALAARLGQAAKRERLYFETKAAAEDECKQLRSRAASYDDASRAMTGEQRLEAWRCLQIALEHGFTLSAAVEAMRAEVERSRRSVLIPVLVEALLADRRYIERSDENPSGKARAYLTDLRNRLGRFAREHQNVRATELSTEALEVWLDSLEVGPTTRNNFRRLLKLVLNYAIRKSWLAVNPAKYIEIARVPDAEVEALTVAECSALLRHARAALLPVFAIGMFAGIRPAEVLRMDWKDVHFADNGEGEIDAPNDDEPGDVDVKGFNAKTAKRRLVTIRPALAEWLVPYRDRTGPIYPDGYFSWYRESRKDRATAGLVRWPADALRHTFCSMDLAHFADLDGLVLRMGHTDAALIYSRYRRVVKPAEAARFWNLTPQSVNAEKPE